MRDFNPRLNIPRLRGEFDTISGDFIEWRKENKKSGEIKSTDLREFSREEVAEMVLDDLDLSAINKSYSTNTIVTTGDELGYSTVSGDLPPSSIRRTRN